MAPSKSLKARAGGRMFTRPDGAVNGLDQPADGKLVPSFILAFH